LCRVYLQQVAASSNYWIIINNEMVVRCNKASVAYFNVFPRYLSGRDSEKPQKFAVNRICVPLKNLTAHSRMQFRSDFITFDFYGRYQQHYTPCKILGWIKLAQYMIQRRAFMNLRNQSTERICWKNRQLSWSYCRSRIV